MSEHLDFSLPVEGRFWDPADESRRVRGQVVWPERSPSLFLEEPLRLPPADSNALEAITAGGRETADVIAGETLDGTPLCLQDCFVTQMAGAKVAHPQRWSAARVYVGTDTPPAEVTRLEVELLGLRDFYGDPLLGEFKTTPVGDRDRVTADWTSSINVEIPFGELAIRFEDDLEGTGTSDLFTLAATPRVHFIPAEPRAVDALRPDVGYLALLVGFCRGQAAELDVLWLITKDGDRVRCLERLRPLPTHAGERVDGWLRLGNLAPLAETFERWHAFCVTNTNSASMLAQYLRDRPRYMTVDRLLVLVRFFEEYAHTAVDSGAIPESKDSVEKVIRFVMKERSAALGTIMGKNKGETFPRAAINTRNYHTHFNPKFAALAADGRDLTILVDRLWALTRAVVLHDLGYDDDAIAGMLSHDPHLGWLAAQP